MLVQIQFWIEGFVVFLFEIFDLLMKYMLVMVLGMIIGQEIDVLLGMKDLGGGYQVIFSFVIDDGWCILLDCGFVDQDYKCDLCFVMWLQVMGNLYWLDEISGVMFVLNFDQNIWFVCDVFVMVVVLDIDLVLVVVVVVVGDVQGVMLVLVVIQGILNNYFSYVV